MSNEIKLSSNGKKLFLNTLNKKGFLLEERTQRVLDTLGFEGLEKFRIFEHEGIRREIDLLYHVKEKVFLIECKKSDYDFVFTKSIHLSDTINIILDTNKGMTVAHVVKNKDFIVTWSESTILFDGTEPKIKNKSEDVAFSSNNLVHDIVKQTLKETEAYTCHKRFINKALYPIVVTNARLLNIDFEENQIDNKGNLTDYNKLNEVPYIVFNFPEMMFWDNKTQILTSKFDDRETHDHVKSIFFVNINHLHELIKVLCKDEYLPRIIY